MSPKEARENHNIFFFSRERKRGGGKQESRQTRQARQAGRQAGKQASRQAGKQASRQAGKQASRQAGKQASRQAGKQASRQAGKQARQAGKQASRQAGTKTLINKKANQKGNTYANAAWQAQYIRNRVWWQAFSLIASVELSKPFVDVVLQWSGAAYIVCVKDSLWRPANNARSTIIGLSVRQLAG